ncbi:LysR substrate-binding domain-containing protein [Paraburkholderia susongensis]|uniref:ModE molybdate transport repressor domain-containing protein n=1 Tax=Paraburkholderia susongensis TaxID=1515439 RepID=A0A1X7LLY9_9BURK|nr:LysR substrate-binding domain-containing protein [Paraburkholderia susongensis]SMG54908.1 ModE molybdate transport repressor domain-containing protein [Paraburkholderia susongensis]
MKSQHLNFFLAMAEHGSIRGAARALGLTQPAVTKTVRTLEKEIGLPLIQRSISGVVLTEHGQALLKHAQRIDNEMRRANEAMAARKDGHGGVVRAAVSASAAITLIPAALEEFTKRLPRARLSLIESSVKSALNGLFDGSLDLAVLQLGPGDFPPHIQTVPLFDVEQRIVVRKGHAHQHATSFGELIDCKWVVPQHPDWRGVFTSPSFWPESLLLPATLVECTSLTIAQSLVRDSNFVSIFPEPSVRVAGLAANIIPVNVIEPLPTLRMSIIYNAETTATDASDVFMTCVKAAASPAHILVT